MFTVTGRLTPTVPVVTLILCDSTPRCVSCHIAVSLCHCVCSTVFAEYQNRILVSPADGTPRGWAPLTSRSPNHTVERATVVRLSSTDYRCRCSGQVPYTPPRATESHPRATPFSHCVVWRFRSIVAVQLCVYARAPPLLRRRCCCRRAALACDDDAAAA